MEDTLDAPRSPPEGSLADRQLRDAARDPRLDRATNRAFIADFFEALAEVERNRFLSILAITEHQAHFHRVERASEGGLQAAWEQSELAKAEVDNDFAYLNTISAVTLAFALDALVEGLAPAVRDVAIAAQVESALTRVRTQEPELWIEVEKAHGAELWSALREAAQTVTAAANRIPRLTGVGVERYEPLLRTVGLAAPADRPLPAGLDAAPAELCVIRNVVAHRGWQYDDRANREAPALPISGALVRLSRADFRRYCAAVRAYGSEICYRLGFGDPVTLDKWTEFVPVNA